MSIGSKVKIVQGCDPRDIPKEVLNSTQPLILEGLAKDWPIVQAGNASKEKAAEYILSFYNNEPLTVFLNAPENKGRFFYNEEINGFNFQRIRGKLDQVLAELFKHFEKNSHLEQDDKTPTCYVGSTNVDHWLPGFRDHNDLSLEPYNPLVSIWLGNQSRIAAHYDFPSNIACSVVGHRRFTLFPPEQLDNLYVGPIDLTPAGQAISLVDFHEPDFEKYPKFKQALENAQVADLKPGDAIFIPSMWWHHVEALDQFNVLVNYWWRTTPQYLGSPFDALLHALLVFKELPEEQRLTWKHLLDFYIFDGNTEKLAHIPEQSRGILSSLDEKKAAAIRNQLLSALKQ